MPNIEHTQRTHAHTLVREPTEFVAVMGGITCVAVVREIVECVRLLFKKRRRTTADHLERSMLWLFNVQCAENMHLTACVCTPSRRLYGCRQQQQLSPIRLRFSE